jgi:hypothetical protein
MSGNGGRDQTLRGWRVFAMQPWGTIYKLESYVWEQIVSRSVLVKGLRTPQGNVMAGEKERLRFLAKRARKRCRGSMCQVGVVAAMGLI